VTASGCVALSAAQLRVPAVNSIGYSMPPVEPPCTVGFTGVTGSTIVMCEYGYGPNHSP
jgi:hypothetical protein